MSLGKILKGGLAGGLVGAAKAGGLDITKTSLASLAARAMGSKGDDEEERARTRRGMRKDMGGPMAGRGENTDEYRRGGKVKKMAKGGSTASKRADGCAVKGKTKGRFV